MRDLIRSITPQWILDKYRVFKKKKTRKKIAEQLKHTGKLGKMNGIRRKIQNIEGKPMKMKEIEERNQKIN
jgi:hypothetical protein